MGWRDRIKKSFAYSAEFAEEGEKLKEKKRGPQTTFTGVTHNTQNTQINLERKKNRTVKDETTKPKPAQEIPAPDPAGLGAEYDRLWRQAWRLADWVDDPDGPPLEDRLARLPELDRLHDRMLEIVRRASENWSEFSAVGRVTNGKGQHAQGHCPAKCKKTGLCYGKTFFTGRPGKSPGPPCDPAQCEYREALKEYQKRQTEGLGYVH